MASLRVYREGVEEGARGIRSGSVRVAVFSPPYFVLDGWSPELMRATGRVLARVLSPGGRAYMVFGPVKEGLARPFDSRTLVLEGARGVLTGWQTIVWVKSCAVGGVTIGHYTPIKSKQLVYYGHEYVLQFVKGDPDDAPPIDRLSIGVPFMDKSNLTRGNRGENGDVHDAGDVWVIPYETKGHAAKKRHRHEFPAEVARRALKHSGAQPGDLVYDPFLGGGTTALVALELGIDCVGTEIDAGSVGVAREAYLEAGGRLVDGIRELREGVYVAEA